MININKQDNSIDEVLLNNFIVENYNFPLDETLLIDKNNIHHIINENFNGLIKYDFSVENRKIIYYQSPSLFIIIKNDNIIKAYSEKITDMYVLFKLIKPLIKIGYSTSVILNKMFYTKSLRVNKEKIDLNEFDDVNELYFPYIKNINNLFKSFLESKESIIIINGNSGTGKSKFSSLYIKFLYNNFLNENKLINIIYLENDDIAITDDFWMYLEDKKIDLVILDDTLVLKNENFVNKLLSYTDGIIKNKTKFIFSGTKIELNSLNEGFRENRIFNLFTFRDLTLKEAFLIWDDNKLPKNRFVEIFTNKDVKKSTLSKLIWEEKNNTKNDFSIDSDIKKEISNNSIGFLNK